MSSTESTDPSDAGEPNEPAGTPEPAQPAEDTMGLAAEAGPAASHPAVLACAVSAAVVLLQFVQTRVYSVHFWNHFVYFIITIALLGFGIAGTWLALGRNTWLARKLDVRLAAVLFVVTSVCSTFVVPNGTFLVTEMRADAWRHLQLLVTYFTAVLPYFFGGWILGIVFRDNASRIHSLYFADLIGAGAACGLFVLVIRPLGAIHLLVVTCLLVAVPCLALGTWRPRPRRIAWGVVGAALAPLVVFANQIDAGLRFDPAKDVEVFKRRFLPDGESYTWLLSEWNAISRVEVFHHPDLPPYWITIDGSASTSFGKNFRDVKPFQPREHRIVTHSPWLFKDDPGEVLVIGAGGGVDVWHSLRAGAKRVDAVELNPTTCDAARRHFKDINGGLFHRAEVTLHNEDGRSFVRRSERSYDVIILSGVDTFNATAAGAYVLSENYLYTVEALADYIGHLDDDGLLCIARWNSVEESLRLFVVAVEALRSLGIREPERHVSLHNAGSSTALLVSRRPFTPAETKLQRKYLLDRGLLLVHPPSEEQRQKPWKEQVPFQRFVYALSTGKEQQFYDVFPRDVSPVYDDSPFFFHHEKIRDLPAAIAKNELGFILRGNWPTFTLAALLMFTVVMVLAFVVTPLIYHARKGAPLGDRRRFATWAFYFSCLGVSFIFIEIALMQRFAILLGHPARSLVLVLGGLLLSAGVGSYLAGRMPKVFRNAALIVCPLAILAAFGYPKLTASLLSLPLWLRAASAVALIAPLGVFMGMPFPMGIHRVEQESRDYVPWMWGINGGTTVVGSILAIVVAMGSDFTTVLTVAGVGYMAAFMAWRRLQRPA